MSFVDDRDASSVDELHQPYKPVDLFKDSDKFRIPIVLPNQFLYLKVRAVRIDVPRCLQSSLIVKALYYKFHYAGLSKITENIQIGYVRRVFDEFNRDPERYFITDERFTLVQISNAIKSLPKIKDTNAVNHQTVFTSALRLVKDPHFTISEHKLAKQILKNNKVFKRSKSDPRESISVRYPDLPYSDAEYIDSIRRCAFIYHRIWSRIRAAFKSKMQEEYDYLHETLSQKPDLAKCLEHHTPPLNKRNLGEHYQDVKRVRTILLKAVDVLDDPCLTETIFLSTIYNKVAFEHYYLDQNNDHLSLKSSVNHKSMKPLLQRWHLGRDGQARYYSSWEGMDVGLGSLISPYLLLLPWGGDELGLYAALLLTERAPSSGLHQMTLNQIKFLDKDGVESNEKTASRLIVSDIVKNRQGKVGNTEVYDKTTDFFKIFKSLYVDHSAALDSGLLNASQVAPFNTVLRLDGGPGKGLFNTSLASSTLASSPLVSLVIKGTHTDKLMQRLSTPAFHKLMVDGSQRLASYKGGVRKNQKLPVWNTISFLAPTAISQSRIISEEAQSLSDVRVSDDMGMTYQEEFDNETRKVAKDQFHSVETRLNTYYLRANAKVVIESRERFAAQVGNEMLVMAEALAEEASRRTALLDLAGAKAVCGLAESELEFTPEELIKQAEAQGSLVNDTAFIRQRDGAKTYVIKSDLHALLMVAKIAQIDNGIEQLLLSNERLVPRAIARRMLIAALLAEFETSMVEKARERFEMLSAGPNPSPIKFPSLVSSLGEYA